MFRDLSPASTHQAGEFPEDTLWLELPLMWQHRWLLSASLVFVAIGLRKKSNICQWCMFILPLLCNLFVCLLKLSNPLLYCTKSSRCPKAMTLSSPPVYELNREVRAPKRSGAERASDRGSLTSAEVPGLDAFRSDTIWLEARRQLMTKNSFSIPPAA